MIKHLSELNRLLMLLACATLLLSATGYYFPRASDDSPSASRPLLKSISISQKSFERYSDNALAITFQYESAGGDLRGGALELSVIDDKGEQKSLSIALNSSKYGRAAGKGKVKAVLEILDSSHLTIKARLVDAKGAKGKWKTLRLDSRDLVDEAILSKIQAFENSVGPEGAESGNTIYNRMAFYNVPAVSIAVVNGGRLEWSRAYGKTVSGGDEDATISTLFQAASLSKAVAAASSMILVNIGDVELDENVNDYLTSWQVPENSNTTSQKVTLERLLSHTAGVTSFGLPGYAQTAQLPTLLQMLDGLPPATNPAVRVTMVPGLAWVYSNLGYLVVQQLFQDIAGIEYSKFAEDNILKPLKMIRSSFNHLIQPSATIEIARGHYSGGTPLAGGWNRFPEHCPAGLWTTPSEYALFLIEILDSQKAKGGKVFSSGDLDEMLRVRSGEYALGITVFVLQQSGLECLQHGGHTIGYLSTFYVFPTLGQGIIIMANSESATPLIDEILDRLGDIYLNASPGPMVVWEEGTIAGR